MEIRITKPELLQRFDDFVRGISKEDKVGLFYDGDPDGVCSGSLVATAIKRIHGKDITISLSSDRKNYGITNYHAEAFKKAGVTKVITCDNAIEGRPEPVDAIAQFADVLQIDNHAIVGEFKSKNILMMKPQLYSEGIHPSRYCTSKMAYDLMSRHCDLSDRDWIAVTGSISDIATEPWMDWVNSVFDKYGWEMKDDLFKTVPGQVAIYINDAICYDLNNIDEVFKAVLESKSTAELFESSIKKYHDIVEAEIQKWISGAKENAEWHDDLKVMFYEVNPKFKIKSALSTILGLKYPEWTLFLAAPDGDTMTLSARSNTGRIAVNKLFHTVLAEFPDAVGGGHVEAAGGSCRVEDYPKFKAKVLKMIQEGFTGR